MIAEKLSYDPDRVYATKQNELAKMCTLCRCEDCCLSKFCDEHGIHSPLEFAGLPEGDAETAYLIWCGQTAKHDAGKPQLTLVPPQIMFEIASVREYGTKKYKDKDNWRRVEPQRYFDAMLRHIFAAWDDMEKIDDESGLMHLAHAATNLAFILQLIKENRE